MRRSSLVKFLQMRNLIRNDLLRLLLCCILIIFVSSPSLVWAQDEIETENGNVSPSKLIQPQLPMTLEDEALEKLSLSEDDSIVRTELNVENISPFNSSSHEDNENAKVAESHSTNESDSTQNGFPQESENRLKIVNKCCKLNQRYENRNHSCVDMENGVVSDMMRMVISPNSSRIMSIWNETGNNVNDSSSEDSVLFGLKISMPDCDKNEITEKIIHMDKLANLNKSTGHGTLESIVLSPSGYLIWQDELGFMNTFFSNDFCIDQINETAFVAVLCKKVCNEKKPCLRKCCAPDSVFDFERWGDPLTECVPTNTPWTPNFYKSADQPVEFNRSRKSNIIFGVPKCKNGEYPIYLRNDTLKGDMFYNIVNGSLISGRYGKDFIVHPPERFCVDGLNGADPVNDTNVWDALDQFALICFPDSSEPNVLNMDDEPMWKYTMNTICAFTSVLFLTLTAIVYLVLWEHQNIHGWLQFAYVLSCLVSFFLLGILQFASDAIHKYNANLCEAMGSVIHFSFLSTFFFMTSMNFDLWLCFSGCRPLHSRSKVGEIKKFCLFAMFSWGCAGIIAGTGLALDIWFKNDPHSNIIRPQFGDRKCYFIGYKEQLPYFYGPLGVLLIIDLMFFLHTVYSLYKLQQDTRFATQQSSRQEKKRFLLFVKLFVVMGVLWIFEILSWISLVYNPENKDIWQIVFLPFDIINGCQGLLIFIIFTCKPNTCRHLEGQFKKFTVFLEEKRDKGIGQTAMDRSKSCLLIAVVTLILPIIHFLRNIFGACGRRGRSPIGRHETGRNGTMTSTFDKYRKSSNTSTTTTMSFKDPIGYELNNTHLHM